MASMFAKFHCHTISWLNITRVCIFAPLKKNMLPQIPQIKKLQQIIAMNIAQLNPKLVVFFYISEIIFPPKQGMI